MIVTDYIMLIKILIISFIGAHSFFWTFTVLKFEISTEVGMSKYVQCDWYKVPYTATCIEKFESKINATSVFFMNMHAYFNHLSRHLLHYVYPRLASTVRQLINHANLKTTWIGVFSALNLDYIVSLFP